MSLECFLRQLGYYIFFENNFNLLRINCYAFPETVAMDNDRILDQAAKSLGTCVCASAVFIASSLPNFVKNAI